MDFNRSQLMRDLLVLGCKLDKAERISTMLQYALPDNQVLLDVYWQILENTMEVTI